MTRTAAPGPPDARPGARLGRASRRRRSDAALWQRFVAGVHDAGLPSGPPVGRTPVGEEELAALPAPARRYLRFSGAVGRPPDWSVRSRFVGRFRLGPTKPWVPFDAWQYDTALDPARLTAMRLRSHGLAMDGWDTYVGGHGRMRGTLLGLVTVADGHGPEFDIGELTTYVDDALMLAPSMLLGPATWAPVDDHTFDVTLSDHGNTSTSRVIVDDDGSLVDISSDDRWCALPGGLVRATWSTPVGGWHARALRRFATGGTATWLLPDGAFTYVEGRYDPATVAWDVAPPTEAGYWA